MNASGLKRTLAFAAAVAVPWIGWSVWSSHREAAAKEALAAEIRAEMAARAPWLPRRETVERPDRTAEYVEILRGLSGDSSVWINAHASDEPWRQVPPDVAEALRRNEAVLARLVAEAEREPPGAIDFKSLADWNPILAGYRGLVVRARADAVQGDLAELLRTVRVIQRMSEAVHAAPPSPDSPLPRLVAVNWDRGAQELLALAALHPELDEGRAAEGLLLVTEARNHASTHEEVIAWRRQQRDLHCLELLGDDAEKAMGRHRTVEEDSLARRAGRLLEGRSRTEDRGPSRPPTAAVLRRMREISERCFDAEMRKDAASFDPAGELQRAATEDLGGGWRACDGFADTWSPRSRRTKEARLPVLRAAFAVRLYEFRNGRPPASLSDLVPSILEAVPVDAWTGRPVAFAPRDGGWSLEAGSPVATVDVGNGVTETVEPYRLERK